jgi:hypothetical protein
LSTSVVKHEGTDEAIRLFTVQDEEGQVSSVMPLRWCISRATAMMLQKQKIDKPELLIVVSNDGEEMERYLVPLLAEMHYISFRRPGMHTVHATIVWPAKSTKESLKQLIGARTDWGRYRMDVLMHTQPQVEVLKKRRDDHWARAYDTEGDAEAALRAKAKQVEAELDDLRDKEPWQSAIRESFDVMKRLDYEARLDVVVPQAMFAKKPPRWMEWLGSRYTWLYAHRDPCELRRRALFTATTLPFVMLFKLVAVLVVETINVIAIGVLLFFGVRNLNFKPLRHPFENVPKDIWRHKKPSVWWTKEQTNRWNEKEYPSRHPSLFVLNPPAIMSLLLAGAVLSLMLNSLLFIVLGLVIGLVLGLLILIGVVLTEPLTRKRKELAQQRKKEEEVRRALRREQLSRELELLACNGGGSREASVSALPRGRRTVVLRYQGFKARVCRPFAR